MGHPGVLGRSGSAFLLPSRFAFEAGDDGILIEVSGALTMPGIPISLTVDAIFAELDRLEKRSASLEI